MYNSNNIIYYKIILFLNLYNVHRYMKNLKLHRNSQKLNDE